MREVWEYLMVDEPNLQALQRRLADAGKEGWEAVGAACADHTRLVVIMKRHAA